MDPATLYIAVSVVYAFGVGIAFRLLANHTEYPDEPFRYPGPTFGSLLWPVAIPVVLGAKVAGSIFGNGTERLTRAEKRREKELAEANHKQELARIQAKTTQELEKALR